MNIRPPAGPGTPCHGSARQRIAVAGAAMLVAAILTLIARLCIV